MAILYRFEALQIQAGPDSRTVTGVQLAPVLQNASFVFSQEPDSKAESERDDIPVRPANRLLGRKIAPRLEKKPKIRQHFEFGFQSSPEMDCDLLGDGAEWERDNLMSSGSTTAPASELQDQDACPAPSDAPLNQRGPLASTATWIRLNRGKRNKAGPNIRRLRKARGLCQADIVQRMAKHDIAMGQGVLAKIEAQQRAIFDYELEAFARILGVSQDELTKA